MATLRADISISELNERSSEYLPGYLGIEILELAPNTLHSRMPIKKLHFAPNDFLHAASIVALADTSCGYATIAHLPEGAQSFTTIDQIMDVSGIGPATYDEIKDLITV